MTRPAPPSPAHVHGILIVDKPQGWTSHDVCNFIRKRFRVAKVGHAGTLDPLATGVLVLLLGKATKQSQTLSSCDKDYFGVMELGFKTDSHDREGKVIARAPWEAVTLEMILRHAADFTGEIMQMPPMVSALKHQGVRLYKLARSGHDIPREKRPVTVYEFKVENKEGPNVHFYARVSKGTYLRTLVNDLGEALGCFAALTQLRRIRSGEFKIEESVTIEFLKNCSIQEFQSRIRPYYYHLSYANLDRT